MHDWVSLVRATVGPLPLDAARARDVVEELAQHVAEEHVALVAAGVPDAEAVARALAPLRDRARVARELAEAVRPRSGAVAPPPSRTGVLEGLWRDAAYAGRILLRAPGFAAVIVLTLGIAVGANAVMFSIVNAVLLRPLPYATPDRLVMIGERQPDGSAGNVGYTTFVDWRTQTRGFEDMALIRSWAATVVAEGVSRRYGAMRVSANFFHMLGVRPALGRDFTSADDSPATWRVVILSDDLWRTRFGADPAVVGRTVAINGLAFQIVGVLPTSYEPLLSEHFYQRAELWAPIGYDTTQPYACRDCEHLKAIGVVKPGVALEAARADIDAVHRRLRDAYPEAYAPNQTMTLVRLRDELTGEVRPALEVLMAAVALVLLIACANVASLLLARVAKRERELGLRAALGATRAQLVRQVLTESLLLSGVGGLLGVAFCAGLMPLVGRLIPTPVVRLSAAGVDARVVLFTAGLSGLTTVLFGLLPALRATRVRLASVAHADARRTARAPASTGRRLLVAADLALAVVLLAGAGLMIRSVNRLLGVNPGFDPDHVLTMEISFVGQAWATDAQVLAGQRAILGRLRSLPGVRAVAAAGQIPLGGNGDRWGFHIQSRPSASPADDPSVERYSVTPDYFAVMRIPLERGRLLTDADGSGAEPVMLIGETTARTLWPGADPLGEHVRIGGADTGPWYQIVGVVGDVRHQALASLPTMQMYTTQAQLTDSYLTVLLRTSGDPAALATAVQPAVGSVAPDVPVVHVAPLEDLVVRSAGPRRFVMLLLSIFSGIALLLTAIGVYSVLAASVAERTREIGIRSALGASRGRIVRLVVGKGMVFVVLGLAAGIGIALATTKYLQDSLYAVSATDRATFVAVIAVLLGVAAVAHAVPASRALRVQPTEALKGE